MGDVSVIWTNGIVNGSGIKNQQTCSVELLGLAIYGHLDHRDQLPCIDAGCQAAMRKVNDGTSVEIKQTRRWRLLVARLGTCHETKNKRVRQRMALWSARSVEYLATDPAVKLCNDVMERFIDGEATIEELKKARTYAAAAADAAYADAAYADAYDAYADAAAYADAYDAYAAAYADAYAADAAYAAAAAYADAYAADAAAAADATAAESNSSDEAYLDWLSRYLDAWGKVAADEGCMVPEDMEQEYLDFVAELDFTLVE